MFQAIVGPDSFRGELFSVRKDGWVYPAEPSKLWLDMSDDDWVQLTPELAEEIIEKDRRWYLEQQRTPAPDD